MEGATAFCLRTYSMRKCSFLYHLLRSWDPFMIARRIPPIPATEAVTIKMAWIFIHSFPLCLSIREAKKPPSVRTVHTVMQPPCA